LSRQFSHNDMYCVGRNAQTFKSMKIKWADKVACTGDVFS